MHFALTEWEIQKHLKLPSLPYQLILAPGDLPVSSQRTTAYKQRYHWAFLIGPKKEKEAVAGLRCHVKNTPIVGWKYEESTMKDVRHTSNLLVRVVVAKIEDEDRLIKILRNLPVINDEPNWRCRTWIAQALAEMSKDGKCVGTAELDWVKIEAFARQYAAEKTAEGRYETQEELLKPKPTWDLLEGKETVP